MSENPDHSPDEGLIEKFIPLNVSYDFNQIGKVPHDKSSRLFAYHCHGLPYKPDPNFFLGFGDPELVNALQPASLRLIFLRDLGDVVESSARFIGESVMQKGPREKALGLQMPFFLAQTPQGACVVPAVSAYLIQQINNLLATDEETRSIFAGLLNSALASIDHSGGMILEIPGIYDQQTIEFVRATAEDCSTTDPPIEVFSPVPLNAALQMAMWRSQALDRELTKPAVVFTDHPGFHNPQHRVVVKSAFGEVISLRELPFPKDRSYEGVPITTMALRKRGSTVDYATDLMRRMRGGPSSVTG